MYYSHTDKKKKNWTMGPNIYGMQAEQSATIFMQGLDAWDQYINNSHQQ